MHMCVLDGSVHGFAILALEGRIAPLLRLATEGTQVNELLDLSLAHLSRE
jgi:hypothetical protein